MLAQSSSMTFGPLASNLLPRSFGHLRLKQFQHLFSRLFGLKRSANCVSHVRSFVLAAVRSRAFDTSLVINVQSLALGLTCHSAARQPMCRAFTQSSRLTSHVARSLLLDNTPTRALQHSAILMIGLLTFGTWALTIRHFGLPGDQPSGLPNAQPFAHSVSFVQTFNLERSCFRPLSLIDSRSFGLYCSTIHLYKHSSIEPFDPSDDQPIGLNNLRPLASIQHVTVDGQQKTERSTGYTPSGSCSPKNTQNINRSTNHVHERSTGYTPMGNCSPKNTQYIRDTLPRRSSSRPFGLLIVFDRSTISVNERSSSRPFGLPLVSTARQPMCTSVQEVGRSASEMFDPRFQPLDSLCTSVQAVAVRPPYCFQPLDNLCTSVQAVVVRPPYCFQPLDNLCERTFKQSTVRPPFGFNRSTISVYEHFKQSVVQPQRCSTFAFNRSTIPLYERSSSRPFGLKGVRPLLSTTPRSMCTSVQVFGRSTPLMLPFGLHDVRPLGFNHPASHATRSLPSVASSIQLL
ncbi:hypothetical protein LR48_Vigan10g193300 [Vigna angularis]|uniref:Uncharacterized protein n=1 Tax=Phaseolus angularis TaxID=3914 RepID=A0A0L9VLW0_PHAAN|nr:hypothetical protein LR48_Vigan10g193300 [Vigna angularis]